MVEVRGDLGHPGVNGYGQDQPAGKTHGLGLSLLTLLSLSLLEAFAKSSHNAVFPGPFLNFA